MFELLQLELLQGDVYCSYKVVECFKVKYLHLISLDYVQKSISSGPGGRSSNTNKVNFTQVFSLFLMDMILTYTEPH